MPVWMGGGCQDRVPPTGQDWGTPWPGQDGVPPLARSGWGTPRIEQQSEHLLHGGRSASFDDLLVISSQTLTLFSVMMIKYSTKLTVFVLNKQFEFESILSLQAASMKHYKPLD